MLLGTMGYHAVGVEQFVVQCDLWKITFTVSTLKMCIHIVKHLFGLNLAAFCHSATTTLV